MEIWVMNYLELVIQFYKILILLLNLFIYMIRGGQQHFNFTFKFILVNN